MAKFISGRTTDTRFMCRHCGGTHNVEAEYNGQGPQYIIITRVCQCDLTPPPYSIKNTNTGRKPTAKEQTVTKEFDTTSTKNTALQGIQQRVEEVERALYNRTHAIAKVEAEHTKLIADANIALTNAVAQAYQMGIEEEDFENHLPDYQDELSERLISVANDMSLANVLEGV